MEFSTKAGPPEKQKTSAIVVGVYEPRTLSAAAQSLDRAAKGALSAITRSGDMEGKAGKTQTLHHLPGVLADRVILLGLGKQKEFGVRAYRDAVSNAMKALSDTGAVDATLALTLEEVTGLDEASRVQQAAMLAYDSTYQFDATKSQKSADKKSLKRLGVMVADAKQSASAAKSLARGEAIARGMARTKELGNMPANICTPTWLANQAVAMAKEVGIKARVMDRAECEKLKMGSFLSVAAGSRQPPKFIVLEYKGGAAKQKPVVLVGKGVTFDTGGISLKPGEGMDEMKFDMCGAASVIGAIEAAARMKLKLNIIALVPATENMPGGAATKPGDVVTSMSGQTIEILNTDAEGRLILCDALTYAERYDPACVIDVATLTGACVIALGHVATGLFSNNEALATEVLAAGNAAHDRAWRMPLWDDYQEQLKSNFADMANIGGRPAGSVTAACFLSRYTRKYAWAHLDIAGTAWKSGAAKGATGRPVPLLTEFLIKRAG